MCAKRNAISDSTHDNWDNQKDPEGRGLFIKSNDEELKNGVFKKPRLTENETSSISGMQTTSVSKGFAGLIYRKSAAASLASKGSPFTSLSKFSALKANAFNANSTVTSESTTSITNASKNPTLSIGGEIGVNDKFTSEPKGNSEHVDFSKIINLNKSFYDWIVKHVEEEPICSLTPTFKDYEKYIKEILEEASQEANNTVNPVPIISCIRSIVTMSANTSTSASKEPLFNTQNSDARKEKPNESENKKERPVKTNRSEFRFDISPAEKVNGNVAPSNSFGFSQTKTKEGSPANTSKSTATSSSFPVTFSSPPSSTGSSKIDTKMYEVKIGSSIGLKKDDVPNSPGFSLASGSTPFTLANAKSPRAKTTKEDDDDDEAPKVKLNDIVEEDALFTKRCKVFLKTNVTMDYGMGILYLKPVKDSEKTQLLVRSSDNFGTILVNVILVDGMVLQRMGKNVMVVHPGTSSIDDRHLRISLFRVKDSNDADELFEMINKHTK